MRTMSNNEHLFKSLDTVIDDEFIPSLFNGRKLTNRERELIALPTRLGGLGIIIPSAHCYIQYENSRPITKQLQDRILSQNERIDISTEEIKSVISAINAKKMRGL